MLWTVVLEKTLESPLESKEIKPIYPKGNQPWIWIFIGRTDAKAEAPILGHLMQRADSLEKTPIMGKTEGKKRRGQQRIRWLDSITDLMDMNLSKLSLAKTLSLLRKWGTGKPGVLQSMELQRVRHNWVTEQQQQLESLISIHTHLCFFCNNQMSSYLALYLKLFCRTCREFTCSPSHLHSNSTFSMFLSWSHLHFNFANPTLQIFSIPPSCIFYSQ